MKCSEQRLFKLVFKDAFKRLTKQEQRALRCALGDTGHNAFMRFMQRSKQKKARAFNMVSLLLDSINENQ